MGLLWDDWRAGAMGSMRACICHASGYTGTHFSLQLGEMGMSGATIKPSHVYRGSLL